MQLDRKAWGKILHVGRVGLNRVQGGQGYSWTGLYLEI